MRAIPTRTRGAHSLATVDRSVIEQMELGLIESRTHVEQMAMDMQRLLGEIVPTVLVTVLTADRQRAIEALIERLPEPANVLFLVRPFAGAFLRVPP